ncbi:myocilin opposite strand protein-like [Mus pahari]|uniref:myocilin opposite strand protein-like n=1 Tax=Mus pahari TaxID=10093 RepID=UPI00111473F9|nr:myocilin opposite strand protein-like [Mus pahari]
MVAFLSKATKCGSGHPPADLGFRGAVYPKPSIGPSEAMVQRNSTDKIDFQNIDLVSEVNRRRKAMATRDETIIKKSGEGGKMLPSMGMDQEFSSKVHLMVPPAPPPSPADASDISKYQKSEGLVLLRPLGETTGTATQEQKEPIFLCLGTTPEMSPRVMEV